VLVLAVLLAAGRGVRMGAPKALLDLGGEPALLRCVRVLRAGGADEVRVVLGPDAAVIRATLEAMPGAAAALHGVGFVLNAEASRGQTSSLRAGLAAGVPAATGFLLHVVDHPLLEADDVAALLAAFRGRPPGRRIAVPEVGGRRGHPAVFEAALADEFLGLRDGEPGHVVVRRDPARVLAVPRSNAWLVRDLDTPEDLAAARAALARGGPGPDQPTSST
jgi:molybdenum cofactor cytidylyltransferase